MGKRLDKLSKGWRLSLNVLPGRTRPDEPGVAARFASECAVTVRTSMPILPLWKEYKKRVDVQSDFIGKVYVCSVT